MERWGSRGGPLALDNGVVGRRGGWVEVEMGDVVEVLLNTWRLRDGEDGGGRRERGAWLVCCWCMGLSSWKMLRCDENRRLVGGVCEVETCSLSTWRVLVVFQ